MAASTFTSRKKRYTVKKCGMTQKQATAEAKRLRKDYPGASTKKMDNGKYCVGTSGKKKSKKKTTKRRKRRRK